MAEYLLASAACFPAFETRRIENSKYIDGGYRNNLPIDMAVELGANEIIAVELKSIGFIPKLQAGDVPVRYIRSYWNLGIFLNFDSPLHPAQYAAWGTLTPCALMAKSKGWPTLFPWVPPRLTMRP